MRSLLPIFFGYALLLHAEEGGVTNAVATNAVSSPTPELSWTNVHDGVRLGAWNEATSPQSQIVELSWTNVPEDCWGDKALPYAQAGLKAWYQETDPKKKAEIAEKVLELANKADATDIGLELFAGKSVAQAELVVPTNFVALPLTVLKEWDLSKNEYGTGYASVIRRIGPKNFELWTPTQGWLFNDKGDVLNEAKVPRHDGAGRQWYGAFLPDGQWITTDLWDRDDRIYLFSKENKLINSFPAGDIAGWGRADTTGTRWVVCVSGYERADSDTSSDLRISPWGWKQRVSHILKRCHLPLPDPSWKFVEKIKSAREFVEPRNLGSRGIRCDEETESDDRTALISWSEPGHGRWVGWPRYSMKTSGHGWESCIPRKDTDNLGFFPGSLTTWVGGNKYPVPPGRWWREESFQSWIIDPDGKVLGWLPAERVGDDPDGRRMWFVDQKGRLLKVAPDGTVSEVMQPTLAGATGPDAPFAHMIFPDLKLGFFYTKPGHLVLARWH